MLWVARRRGRCGTGKRAPRSARAPIATGDARASMKGVAARHPASIRPRPAVNLEPAHQRPAAPSGRKRRRFAYESKELLALNRLCRAPVAGASDRAGNRRSYPAVPGGGPGNLQSPPGPAQPVLRPVHDDNWGSTLAGSVIPQAHPTGYPSLIAWSGRAWVRSSGGCATASPASARKCPTSAPPSSSIWSSS